MTATQRQFGKYRLLKKIATGGMGEIFEARHVDQPETKPPVALKRILKHHSKDKRFVRMFFKEAKIITEFDHPNLIRVQDFGKEQDQFYMTMEYVEGHNLDAVLSLVRESPAPWTLACGIEVVRQALEGMAYAHTKQDRDGNPLGIVHLDLSPHNMMLSPDGQVKILDFGISKAIYEDDQKAFNALRGTYSYMSPEQCREQPVDARSDLFTLGIVLYELTTMTPLFSRQPSEFMILKAITEGLVPPPSNNVKDFPPELEKVIDKALKVNREERYARAEDFRDALLDVVRRHNLPTGPEILASAMKALLAPAKPADPTPPPHTAPVEAPKAQAVDRRKSSESPENLPADPSPSPAPRTDYDVMSAVDRDELLLATQQKRRMIWTAFSVLLVLILGLATYAHYEKTGWLPQEAGGNVYMPEKGVLFVDSEPRGARVFVNRAKAEGETPLHVRNLPLNEAQEIELVVTGRKPVVRKVTLTARKPLEGIWGSLPE